MVGWAVEVDAANGQGRIARALIMSASPLRFPGSTRQDLLALLSFLARPQLAYAAAKTLIKDYGESPARWLSVARTAEACRFWHVQRLALTKARPGLSGELPIPSVIQQCPGPMDVSRQNAPCKTCGREGSIRVSRWSCLVCRDCIGSIARLIADGAPASVLHRVWPVTLHERGEDPLPGSARTALAGGIADAATALEFANLCLTNGKPLPALFVLAVGITSDGNDVELVRLVNLLFDDRLAAPGAVDVLASYLANRFRWPRK
jgi:hypothetical protein